MYIGNSKGLSTEPGIVKVQVLNLGYFIVYIQTVRTSSVENKNELKKTQHNRLRATYIGKHI